MARSIHIGLNNVDPNAYNGWDGALSGCINDANDMHAIAVGLGYQSLLLTDSDATADRVIAEIGQTAADLQSGDIFFLSYSGHGGQVDDVNGDEEDALDETWVLWDRQLIDDELYALWGQFAAGVRIVVLSDSCHSGTVLRKYTALQDIKSDLARTRAVPTATQAATLVALSKELGLDTEPAADVGARKSKKMMPSTVRSATKRYRGSTGGGRPVVSLGIPKRMPADIQTLVNTKRARTHAAAQWLAGPSEKAAVNASVILISGCQDDQLSMDGAGNGLFSEKLKQVWDNSNFGGDYRDFWTAIKSLMPAKQQPNYMTVGAANPQFEGQSPFEISDGGAVTPQPQPQPQPTPTPSGTRPTLSGGASGGDVEYLQTRLRDLGYYNGAIDGAFGPMTASAVRAFQNANGLEPDGIVGPATWEALG
jgi:metacaspase-1